jgi:hypothetical protein
VSVSKLSKPGKKSVDLQPEVRPSRIRRDPVPAEKPSSLGNNAWWDSRTWEIRLAILGIIFFALAINAVVFDIGELLSK